MIYTLTFWGSNSKKSCLCVCLLALSLLLGCGSAAEFDSNLSHQNFESTEPIVLGLFEGSVSPFQSTIEMREIDSTNEMAQKLFFQQQGGDYLAAKITNFNLANWNTRVYDFGSNILRVDYDSKGACIESTEDQTISNFQARFTQFNHSSIIAGAGATASGSDYIVDYGNLPKANTSCRTFAFQNPSQVAGFKFIVSLEGTLGEGSEARIANVSDTNWNFPTGGSKTITITGFGFAGNGDGEPVVKVGAATQTVQESTNTTITLKINSDITAGTLTVDPPGEANPILNGPYIIQTTALQSNLDLTAGQDEIIEPNIWWYLKTGVFCPAVPVSGCPVGLTDDIEFRSDLSILSPDLTDLGRMSYISITGSFCAYVGVDKNQDGYLNSGDIYRMLNAPISLTGKRINSFGTTITIGTNSISSDC